MKFVAKLYVFLLFFQNEPNLEQEIIETLMNALKLCDTDTQGDRQLLYTFRKGMVYHRLANVYRNSYVHEVENEPRKKKLLQLVRLYYEKSAKTFEHLGETKEQLQIQCDRLQMQDILCEGTLFKLFSPILFVYASIFCDRNS